MNTNDIFLQDLNAYGLKLDADQIDKFDLFYNILVSENEKFNLTSVTERVDVYKKHFIDSLSLCTYGIDLFGDIHIIDIGTGAGFPGIPLKIVFPHLKITLVDSLNKRISFLENVIDKLKLSNIIPIHGRAEDLAKNSSHREKYDLCVSRAVANLSTLTEYCLPFVKPDGLFIAYKVGRGLAPAEITDAQNCISLLGGQLDKRLAFELPNSDITRSLIGVKKISVTPEKYPRRAGLPGKRPL